jgi:GAF domain-containing protein
MSVEWQFVITLNEHLRSLRNPLEIQETALRLLCKHLDASRVTFAYIDGDEFAVSRSYVQDAPLLANRGPLTRFGKVVIDACRRGETSVINDVHSEPGFTVTERDLLLKAQTGAFVTVPLIKEGQWLAAFGVMSITPRLWSSDQIALIELTAERTWGIGERARAEEALGRTESRQMFSPASDRHGQDYCRSRPDRRDNLPDDRFLPSRQTARSTSRSMATTLSRWGAMSMVSRRCLTGSHGGRWPVAASRKF